MLSVFVATFTYSTAGLYTVGVEAGQRTEEYPRLAVSGALLLLFLSLVMLVFFVHHLAHSIQIDEIMARVERSTLRSDRPRPADRRRDPRVAARSPDLGRAGRLPTGPVGCRRSIQRY